MSVLESGAANKGEAVIEGGLLFCGAKSVPWEAVLAAAGYAYSLSSYRPSGVYSYTVTGTGGDLLILRNDSSNSKVLVVRSITAFSDTAGIRWHLKRNVTIGTLGNHESLVPYNRNTGIADTPITGAYGWTEAGNGITGLTGGDVLATGRLAVGPNPLGPQNGVVAIIPVGGNIVVGAVGASEVSFLIEFYMLDATLVDLLKL